jgi:hypothetical protein
MGGGFVTGRDFIETSAARHPLSLEETLYSAVIASLKENPIVFVDDVDLIHDATSSCHFYPRGQYVETALLELSDAALREEKKLFVSTMAPSLRRLQPAVSELPLESTPLPIMELYSERFLARSPPPASTPRRSIVLRRSSMLTRFGQLAIGCAHLALSRPISSSTISGHKD